MNFPFFTIKRKRKKGADGAKVRGTESIHKERPQISFEARVTQLKDAGTDGIAIRVKRETGQRGVMTKRWRLSEVDLSTFDSEVLAEGGGGAYTAEFLLNKVPMTLEGSTRIESYEFEIAGPPKTTEAKKKEPEPKGWNVQRLVSDFVANPEKYVAVITVLNTLLGRDGKQTQMDMLQGVSEVIKNLKDMGSSDDLEKLEKYGAMYAQMAQTMRPPVQTTGPVGSPGIVEQILKGISPEGFAMLERLITQSGQLRQTTAGAQIPQTTSGGAMPSWVSALPQYHDTSWIVAVRQMIVNKAEPDQVGMYIVDALDTYGKIGGDYAPVEYKELLQKPGIAFERFWADIPELPADVDEEYKQAIRTVALALVEEYKLQEQMRANVVQQHDIPQSEPARGPALQPESEPALQPEPESGTHAVDGEPATSGEDAVAESASQRDG